VQNTEEPSSIYDVHISCYSISYTDAKFLLFAILTFEEELTKKTRIGGRKKSIGDGRLLVSNKGE
jgi:hypothetical protein